MIMLALTRPEKALLVAALCITHKELQPTISMDISLELANETLTYPGIVDLLRLTDSSALLSLLELITVKNNINLMRGSEDDEGID